MHISKLKENNRNIMIFGLGIDAVRCSYKLEMMNVKYEGFVVSKPERNIFKSRGVFSYDSTINKDYFYIIATSYASYVAVSNMFRNSGKKEFVDYIFFDYLEKKIIYLHGNCHMDVIEKYLNSSVDFKNEYVFYHAPRLTMGCELRCEEEIFQNIDLWIHQDVRNDNCIGYMASDEYIRSLIDRKKHKDTVKEIVVPNLYGMGKGFFPQNGDEKSNKKNESIMNCSGVDYNGMFCMPDCIIDRCLEDKLSVDEIICHCKEEGIFEEGNVRRIFKLMLKKIECRESNWDIKVLQFIIDNYKEKKLFYDAFHPTNDVLKYISEEILKILNIKEDAIYCEYTLDTHEEPVYPDVARILGLKWQDKELRKSERAKKCDDKMGFEEYIKEYIWWIKDK